MIAMDPARPEPYVLEEERTQPESGRTTFLLRPLTGRDFLRLKDIPLEHLDGDMGFTLSDLGRAVEFGLAGWQGMRDSGGADVAYDPQSIERLPAEVLIELGGEIIRRSRVGVYRKNSPSVPGISPAPSSTSA